MTTHKKKFEDINGFGNVVELLEKKLLPVYNVEEQLLVVLASDLLNFLDVWSEKKRSFPKWVNSRIFKYSFSEGIDYVPCVKNNRVINYVLSIEMAKNIALLERSGLGSVARKYFAIREERVKPKSNLSLKSLKIFLDNYVKLKEQGSSDGSAVEKPNVKKHEKV